MTVVPNVTVKLVFGFELPFNNNKKMSKSFVVSKNVLIFAPPNVQIKPNKKT